MKTRFAKFFVFGLPILVFSVVAAERQRETNTVVQIFAGSGIPGFLDGKGVETFFYHPRSMAFSNGVLWVWDEQSRRMRKIAADGTVTSLPSNAFPSGVFDIAALSDGSIAVAEPYKISKVLPDGSYGVVTGYSTQPGYADGASVAVRFGTSFMIAVGPKDVIYVADTVNQRIRKVADGVVTTLAGSGVQGTQDGRGVFCSFDQPSGIAVNLAGEIFVMENTDLSFRKITPEGVVSTVQKLGGFVRANATFSASPVCLPDGSILAHTLAGEAIARLSSDGTETILAGGISGLFRGIGDVEFDGTDSYYVSEYYGHRIFKVTIPRDQPVPPSALALGN